MTGKFTMWIFISQIIDPNRKTEKQGHTIFFFQGFGLSESGAISPLEQEQADEASKMKACYIGIGIKEVPQPFDSQSDKSKPPTSDVDARILLKALIKEGHNLENTQVNLSGFSEGAAIAISLAGEIDQKQKSNTGMGNFPQNTLRLWSLTGVVNLTDRARGTHTPTHFLAEVSKITLVDILDRWQAITGKPYGSFNSLADLTNLGANIAHLVTTIEGRKQFMAQFRDTSGKNLDLLKGVLKRVVNPQNLPNLLYQFRKRR